MASKSKVQKDSSDTRTYMRHRVQSYVNAVEGADQSGEEYETEIPANELSEFVDEETVKVAEEVIEVSNISRGLIAETILGTDNSSFTITSIQVAC